MTTKATAGDTNEQELEEQFVELLDHYRGETRGAGPSPAGRAGHIRLSARGRHETGGRGRRASR